MGLRAKPGSTAECVAAPWQLTPSRPLRHESCPERRGIRCLRHRIVRECERQSLLAKHPLLPLANREDTTETCARVLGRRVGKRTRKRRCHEAGREERLSPARRIVVVHQKRRPNALLVRKMRCLIHRKLATIQFSPQTKFNSIEHKRKNREQSLTKRNELLMRGSEAHWLPSLAFAFAF